MSDAATDRDGAREIIRREERLRAGVESVATERVRIERVVVTEQRTVTVDVRREELRVHREALGETDRADATTAAERQPIVVVLREEQVAVTKTVVPVERVTVHVDRVTTEQTVAGTVRREEIAFDPPSTS